MCGQDYLRLYFVLQYSVFCAGKLWLSGCLLHGKARFWQLLLGGAVGILVTLPWLSPFPAILLEFAALTALNRLLFRRKFFASAIAALLGVTVTALLMGMSSPLVNILSASVSYPMRLIPLLLLLTQGILWVSAFFTLRWIGRSFSLEDRPAKFYLLLFFPLLLFLLVFQLISELYGSLVVINEELGRLIPNLNDWEMLAILAVAFLSLLLLLRAFQKLAESARLELQNSLLSEQAEGQRVYLQEANSRYAQTRAFRHDVKNHLLLLDGLLRTGQVERAREYLGGLGKISDRLSFPVNTGNATVDILLSSKLSAAREQGIRTECALNLPQGLDDIDLCIVLSNAVDNAVSASVPLEAEKRFFRLSGSQRGKLFLLKAENSQAGGQKIQFGVGLDNIRAVAEKYHGTVSVESQPEVFRLHVLFVRP